MDFKDDLIEYRCLCCNNDQQNFDEKLNKLFFNTYTKFILFREKVFILMNIWTIRKNSKKHRYLKKNIFTVT